MGDGFEGYGRHLLNFGLLRHSKDRTVECLSNSGDHEFIRTLLVAFVLTAPQKLLPVD